MVFDSHSLIPFTILSASFDMWASFKICGKREVIVTINIESRQINHDDDDNNKNDDDDDDDHDNDKNDDDDDDDDDDENDDDGITVLASFSTEMLASVSMRTQRRHWAFTCGGDHDQTYHRGDVHSPGRMMVIILSYLSWW